MSCDFGSIGVCWIWCAWIAYLYMNMSCGYSKPGVCCIWCAYMLGSILICNHVMWLWQDISVLHLVYVNSMFTMIAQENWSKRVIYGQEKKLYISVLGKKIYVFLRGCELRCGQREIFVSKKSYNVYSHNAVVSVQFVANNSHIFSVWCVIIRGLKQGLRWLKRIKMITIFT